MIVRLAHRRLAIGQRLPVEIRVEKGDGQANPNADVKAVVQTPSGQERAAGALSAGRRIPFDLLADRRGRRLCGHRAGQRRRQARRHAHRQVSRVRGRHRRCASLPPTCRPMRALSETTGGEYHSPEEFPAFIRSLKSKDLNLEVSQPVYESLWDRWEFFVLFLFFAAAEWIVRKRRDWCRELLQGRCPLDNRDSADVRLGGGKDEQVGQLGRFDGFRRGEDHRAAADRRTSPARRYHPLTPHRSHRFCRDLHRGYEAVAGARHPGIPSTQAGS